MQNISFRIDEAHHISNVFHEDELELYNRKDRQTIIDDATRLGNIVRYVLRVDEPTVKLHLTTATFFRGDRKTIISKALRERFVHFYLTSGTSTTRLWGCQDLRFDFLEYDKTPVQMVLEAVRKEPGERHLIIIPSLTTRYRTVKTHALLLEGLRRTPVRKCWIWWFPERRNGTRRVCTNTRMRFASSSRAVCSTRGWIGFRAAACTTRCAGEASLTLAVQRFFRPLRKHADKKRRVVIRNYIPRFSPELEMGERTEDSIQPFQCRAGVHRHPGGTDAERHSLNDRRNDQACGNGYRCRKRTATNTAR